MTPWSSLGTLLEEDDDKPFLQVISRKELDHMTDNHGRELGDRRKSRPYLDKQRAYDQARAKRSHHKKGVS